MFSANGISKWKCSEAFRLIREEFRPVIEIWKSEMVLGINEITHGNSKV